MIRLTIHRLALTSPTKKGGAPAFSPARLFLSGERGVFYDPSDLSTLFQDTAGTQPVTAAGQSVARINDKSGRGNHATQANAASRPLYQVDGAGRGYLLFDGVDDSLATGIIDFTSTDKMTVIAGVRKLSDATAGSAVSLGVSPNSGYFELLAPLNAGSYRFASRGTLEATVLATGLNAPITNVVTAFGNIGGDVALIRTNGSQKGLTAFDQGAGAYAAQALTIGRRINGTVPFNGRLYSLIVRGAATDLALIEQTEAWVNAKTGAY